MTTYQQQPPEIPTFLLDLPESEFDEYMNHQFSESIKRKKWVMDISGISAPTLYRLMHDKKFPKSKSISEGTKGWLASEVIRWLYCRVNGIEYAA